MKKKSINRKKHALTCSMKRLLGIGLAIYFVFKVSTITYYDIMLYNNGNCTIAEIYRYEGLRYSRVKGYYEFSVKGQWYKGYATSLSDEKLKNRISHDTITIMYLPTNPQINRSKNAVENDLFVVLINKFKVIFIG